MRALAQAKKGAAFKAVSCLLECTRGTQFELALDERCLKDIGEILNVDSGYNPLPTESTLERKEDFERIKEEEKNRPKQLGACIVHDDLKMTEDELANFLKRR